MIKTKITLTFEPDDYKYPQWLPFDSQPTVKPTVKITVADITYASQNGVSWEQLEALYGIDKEALQRHLTLVYNKGQAELQVRVLDSMVKSATVEGNATTQKFLAQNWLGMTEKVVPVPVTQTVDEDSLNSKLQSLMNLYGSHIVKE